MMAATTEYSRYGPAASNGKVENCVKSPEPVAFTVVFKDVTENVSKPCRVSQMRRKEDLSKETIEEKLLAAEVRRKCHEEELKAKLAVNDERMKKAKMAVHEMTEHQSKSTEEKLKHKMGSHEKLKREKERALLDRLYAKDEHVCKVKANLQERLEAQCKIAEEKIMQKEARSKEKLEAQQKTLEQIKQAREQKMKEVQTAKEARELKEQREVMAKLQHKMRTNSEKREARHKVLMERLHSMSLYAELAREAFQHKIEERSKITEKKLNEKMEKYEQKRNDNLEAMISRLAAHNGKHVEEVQRRKLQRQEGQFRQG